MYVHTKKQGENQNVTQEKNLKKRSKKIKRRSRKHLRGGAAARVLPSKRQAVRYEYLRTKMKHIVAMCNTQQKEIKQEISHLQQQINEISSLQQQISGLKKKISRLKQQSQGMEKTCEIEQEQMRNEMRRIRPRKS